LAEDLVIYVADVGSIAKKKFAWVSSAEPKAACRDIRAMGDAIANDLRSQRKVAIGFECPLFIPCPEDEEQLGRARKGECSPLTGNKPFSASAGACVAMTGLPELGWVLRHVKSECPNARATTQWREFDEGDADIFAWEAFVAGKSKGKSHHEDARRALQAFQDACGQIEGASCVTCDAPFSLAGALVIWAGLSDDESLLHKTCSVLRPRGHHEGSTK
jgi:hypothetical protein